MGKNLVVRLHVYLMCFLLAFSPAYAYASAAPKLDFTGIANFVRDAGGATADYLFKRSANDPNYNAANDDRFETKAHRVPNSQLSKVGLARMLNPQMLVGGLIFGFVVDELITQMQADDWIVDQQNQSIYKYTGAWCLRQNTPNFPSGSTFCSSDPAAAVQLFFDKTNDVVRISAKRVTSSGDVYYLNHLKYSSPVLFDVITDSTRAVEVRADYQTSIEDGEYNSPVPFSQFFLDKVPQAKVEATPADVEAVLPKVSDAQIAALATSPDPVKEAHAPTAAAAAKAAPKTDTPKDPPKDNNNKCPAGQSFDASTGKCKAATAAQCPVGQVYDFVQKKCTSLKLPDEDDDWPEFCEWAAPVCEFIEWAKQDVDKFEAEKVDVEDTADDAQSITSQILTLGYVSGGVKSCPSDLDLSFQFMGQSIGFEISYAPLCEMLLTARPVVIAIAYFQAAKIVFLGRRD